MNVVALPTNRQPPAIPEAEQGVLGALMGNNDLYPAVCGFLDREHFAEPLNGEIYDAIGRKIKAGETVNAITIMGELPRNIDGFPVNKYVAQIAGSAWTTLDHIVETAREIVRTAARRRLIDLSSAISDQSTTPGLSASDIIGETETQLIALSDELAALAGRDRSDDPDAILGAVSERMRTGRHWKGATCGIAAIDNRLGGFGPGELVLIGARPSMGKTALSLGIARMAATRGHGVAFISLEMPKAQLWHRLLSDECETDRKIVPYDRIGKGMIEDDEFSHVAKANDRLKRLPLYIADKGERLSDLPGHIRSARRWLERRGSSLEILIIDYLGLMKPGERYAGNRVGEVTEISATLKSIAKREGLPVIALHQLNRANESQGRTDFRPRLSDLRDSGALEQDADVVMFVHRDAYYIERGVTKFASEDEQVQALLDSMHKMEIIVAKNRQGSVGPLRLWCDMATNAVRDVAI